MKILFHRVVKIITIYKNLLAHIDILCILAPILTLWIDGLLRMLLLE